MSGSGGSSSGPDYVPTRQCEDLVIDTQLSSPKPDVVAGISNGDVLDVEAQQMNGTTVVVALHNGNIAGGLASPEIQRLRECIAKGVEYAATVTAKKGGQVSVRVAVK